MRPTPWLAPETPDLVWFRGSDAVRFLNDLISQEIGALDPGRVRRSLLLGPQGKLDHMLWALREEDEVGLMADPGRGGELAATLGRYRIRVDVEISEEQGDRWLVVGEYEVEPGRWQRTAGGLIADVSWRRARRALVVGERPGLEAGTEEEYEVVRIAAGEPRWGVDIDEKTIPQEAGLVEESVDFDKGCFLGQELVARIDSRGSRTPRHLCILDLGEGSAQPGAPVVFGDKEVGSVTSATGNLGLALVRREVSPGDTVSVNGVSAVVRDIR